MGFYDNLGQAAGGTSSGLLLGGPIGGLIGLGAGIFGGLSQNAQRERERRTQNDELRLRAQQLALQTAAFNRGAPGARMSDALHGDVLAGLQPYQLHGEGRTVSGTGGLTPALISAGSRQLGQEVARRALLSELGQGDQMIARPNAPSPVFHGWARRLNPAIAAQWPTSTTMTIPDPYSFLPFGGFPIRGGSHSLWPDPLTGEGRPG